MGLYWCAMGDQSAKKPGVSAPHGRAHENLHEASESTTELVFEDDASRPRDEPEAGGVGALRDADPMLYGERYEDVRLLGSGGSGEVRRVRDHKLGRVVAMKVLRPDIELGPKIRARFLAEIRLTAGLDHPGIVAVHDFGELPDGRMWFTMREVRGRTLHTVIEETFAALLGGTGTPRFTPRRLLDAFVRVCETMAYAHSHGVIHRDLKPSNIMVGTFGEVMVMDWGIARHIGSPLQEGDISATHARRATRAPATDPLLTQQGDILGTPAYMAPEQARGEVARHGPAADVYALGAILYHVLAGRPPHVGLDVWSQVLERPPPPLADVAAPGVEIAPDLAAICARAMAREPEDRYPDAGALAADMVHWLDGAQRRERALTELARVMAMGATIADLDEQAAQHRARARRHLSDVRPFDPVEVKAPGWALEDQAEGLEREAALQETRWLQGVYGALAIAPNLPEAHAALADHYSRKLVEAERARRHADAARCEVMLAAHDRGQHAAILGGRGALTLVTEPAGARVTLYRHVERRRRMVAERVGELGRTPLVEVALDKGSYLLHIAAPGRTPVRYPVHIERGGHWHGRAPGSTTPHPVPLPLASELDEDEIYVPPGWTWTGGDPEAPDGLPRRLVWIDGFIMGRFPVTNEQYLAFLDDLVAAGREDEALAACPRAQSGMVSDASDTMAYLRDARGAFSLAMHPSAEPWRPRTPAVQMSWHGAMAYARWRAARTGRAYRLPNELEREKAVRGADGRLFPWGNHFDPTWACALSSHAGTPVPAGVDSYPIDESPYGLRGGGGNSRDWCINRWTHEGPAIRADRLCIEPAPPDDQDFRSIRGGAWSSVENHCHAAARFANRPDQRRHNTGLRLARSYP